MDSVAEGATTFGGLRCCYTVAMIRILLILPLCLLLSAKWVWPWGTKGHIMQGRVAARALPGDMPLFFRAATERLAYLIPEPDRWRGEARGGLKGARIELTNATAANHNVRLEVIGETPFPQTRYQFVALALERGWIRRDDANLHQVGAVFYAMVEELQRLTVQFRLWREAQEAPALDPAALQQIQENAIFSAGVLGHWITDASQPLHTTVHSDDWDPRYPNPRNYQSKQIHGRFETAYVEQKLTEADIAGRLSPLRLLDDWRSEAEAHIRRAFSHFETVYSLDQRGTFGTGNEPVEAHGFTADRLAEGASMLRDAWYSAWRKSEQELLETPVLYRGSKGKTVLDLLTSLRRVELGQDVGKPVMAIGDRRNGQQGRSWQLFVNGKPGDKAPDRYVTGEFDVIEWRFVPD
jgi:hypothetical protein